MTKKGRPVSVAPASSTLAMDSGDHDREGLPLGLEPGHHLARVQVGPDDLERDPPLDRGGLLGLVHDPHPALTQDPEDAVGADD